jgi:hypothetical protein
MELVVWQETFPLKYRYLLAGYEKADLWKRIGLILFEMPIRRRTGRRWL